MNAWEVCDIDHKMMCNLLSGTYMGCSLSPRTYGRLFTSGHTVDVMRPIIYHCIAWSEL